MNIQEEFYYVLESLLEWRLSDRYSLEIALKSRGNIELPRLRVLFDGKPETDWMDFSELREFSDWRRDCPF